jgi:hypothetical protein
MACIMSSSRYVRAGQGRNVFILAGVFQASFVLSGRAGDDEVFSLAVPAKRQSSSESETERRWVNFLAQSTVLLCSVVSSSESVDCARLHQNWS